MTDALTAEPADDGKYATRGFVRKAVHGFAAAIRYAETGIGLGARKIEDS